MSDQKDVLIAAYLFEDLARKDFDAILSIVENAKKTGAWVVLAGHDMGRDGSQTTRLAMLEKLCAYATDPANGVWIAPVGTVARYVRDRRSVVPK